MQRSNRHRCWSTPGLQSSKAGREQLALQAFSLVRLFGIAYWSRPTCVRTLRLDLARALAVRLKTLQINTVTAAHSKHRPAANNSVFPRTVYVGANTVIPPDS